jgi:class 3 adenylate cyclase
VHAEKTQTDAVALVIADISGYTRFARMHRLSQAHAEHIICELLEAVIARTENPLQLHQLLGDAAVFYALSDGSKDTAAAVFEQVRHLREGFDERASELTGDCTVCVCEACRNAGRLKLKVIVHHGEAVITSLRGIDKIAGEDVILAHRLLKNSVPADEYVLLTATFADLLGEVDDWAAEPRREHCEGVGEIAVRVYHPTPPAPGPANATPLPSRLARTVRLDAYYALRRLALRGPKQP